MKWPEAFVTVSALFAGVIVFVSILALVALPFVLIWSLVR